MKHLAMIIQLFVNEFLTDKIRIIKGKNKPLEIKMDVLEWLSRFARFISPENAYSVVQAFRDFYQQSPADFRAFYTQADHGSEAIICLLQQLQKIRSDLLRGSVNTLEEQTDEVAKRNFVGHLNVHASYDTKL